MDYFNQSIYITFHLAHFVESDIFIVHVDFPSTIAGICFPFFRDPETTILQKVQKQVPKESKMDPARNG